jgi:NADPH:quinone reductase-like Zn-dependent oxidoreductase
MTRSKNVSQLRHKPNVKDLLFIKELIEAGKLVPIIDRTYPLNGIAEALQYYGEGHPSGKVVINMDHTPRGEV